MYFSGIIPIWKLMGISLELFLSVIIFLLTFTYVLFIIALPTIIIDVIRKLNIKNAHIG